MNRYGRAGQRDRLRRFQNFHNAIQSRATVAARIDDDIAQSQPRTGPFRRLRNFVSISCMTNSGANPINDQGINSENVNAANLAINTGPSRSEGHSRSDHDDNPIDDLPPPIARYIPSLATPQNDSIPIVSGFLEDSDHGALSIANQQILALNKTKKKLLEKLNDVKLDNKSLEAEIYILNRQIKGLNKRIENLDQENTSLKNEIKRMSQHTSDNALEDVIDEPPQEELAERNAQLLEKLSDAHEEIERLNQRVEELLNSKPAAK